MAPSMLDGGIFNRHNNVPHNQVGILFLLEYLLRLNQ
jgi:hypothetical protein